MNKTQQNESRADYLRIFGPPVLLALVAFFVAYQFVAPAPPSRIVMATGEPGGAYHAYGERYREVLARDNIELELRTTAGSAENISLLEADDSDVQVAFVQGGMHSFARTDGLASLATLYYEPLWIFHRSEMTLERLGALANRRVYAGPEDSGSRALALLLLADNSIGPDDIELVSLASGDAASALRSGTVDAVFLVASHASSTVRQLLEADGISLMSLQRAEGYVRRHRFLSKQILPQGVIDFAADLPPEDVRMLAPTSNLVASQNLHPALVDLLLQAADHIHDGGSLFALPGEFPSPDYLDFPLNVEAKRFFEHGPPFLRSVLPFWAATLIDRMKVMLLPLFVLAFPLFKFMPPVYQWRMRERVYRWYKEIRAIELGAGDDPAPELLDEKISELDRIETEVQVVSVPPGYSEDLYHLRLHIGYVRDQLRRRQ